MHKIISKFLSRKSTDVFTYKKQRYLRGFLKKCSEELAIIKTNLKVMEEFKKLPSLDNPFNITGFKMSPTQEFINSNASKFPIIGTMGIKCSCGAGKTLAGILLIQKLGFKTLIVSNRCAINEQWKQELTNIYKDKLLIRTREGLFRNGEKLKETKETNKETKETNKETKETNKETKETDKETKETNKKTKETDKKTKETNKETKETDKETKETNKKTKETDKKTNKETNKKTKETDKKTKETNKETKETNKETKEELTTTEADIYIYSPQYLNEDIKKFPSDVGLIIYDEIHSLLSPEFSKVITTPFINVIHQKISELPYMLCMSATYPSRTSNEYRELINIFGVIYEQPSSITDIPIYVFDIRDHLKKGIDDKFDKNYIPMDDTTLINKILNNKVKFYNENIETTILNYPQYCGFVITSTINSSVYSWLRFYEKYKDKNKRCILIRENVKGCYLLTSDVPEDLLLAGPLITEERILKHPDFDKFCTKLESYKQGDILFGTYHRLKEGISVQNAVWGICSMFVWSHCSRVQILGRIRRSSTNEELNKFKRYFIVNSRKIPTNLGKLISMKKSHRYNKNKEFKLELEYDIDEEKQLFDEENYIRI